MEVLQIAEVKQRFRDLTPAEKQELQQLLTGPSGSLIMKVLGPDFVQEFQNVFSEVETAPTPRRGLASR
jgi:hypothetical protein